MIRNASRREIFRIGRRFAPQLEPHRPDGLLQALKRTLQSGDVRNILILGASAKGALTRLVVEAAKSNPNLPTVTCAGSASDSGFRRLEHQLRSIPEFSFKDAPQVIDELRNDGLKIDAVVIDQIDVRLALQLSTQELNCGLIFVSVSHQNKEDSCSVPGCIDETKYCTTREWRVGRGNILMMRKREAAVEQQALCHVE